MGKGPYLSRNRVHGTRSTRPNLLVLKRQVPSIQGVTMPGFMTDAEILAMLQDAADFDRSFDRDVRNCSTVPDGEPVTEEG